MPISRSGRANESFLDNLEKLLPKLPVTAAADKPQEEQLADERKDKSQEAVADKPTEGQLDEDRKKPDEAQNYEGKLEDSRKEAKAAAPNADKEGTTEQRLNDASKDAYPHRNEKAYERTGDKRPVNALREEMGNASDAAKNERYEKANKSGEPRIVDKDVGSQMSNKKAFNLKQRKSAMKDACGKYIDYKNQTASSGDVKLASLDKFAEVKEIDAVLSEIMASSELTHDDMAKIAALKQRKSDLLLGR